MSTQRGHRAEAKIRELHGSLKRYQSGAIKIVIFYMQLISILMSSSVFESILGDSTASSSTESNAYALLSQNSTVATTELDTLQSFWSFAGGLSTLSFDAFSCIFPRYGLQWQVHMSVAIPLCAAACLVVARVLPLKRHAGAPVCYLEAGLFRVTTFFYFKAMAVGFSYMNCETVVDSAGTVWSWSTLSPETKCPEDARRYGLGLFVVLGYGIGFPAILFATIRARSLYAAKSVPSGAKPTGGGSLGVEMLDFSSTKKKQTRMDKLKALGTSVRAQDVIGDGKTLAIGGFTQPETLGFFHKILPLRAVHVGSNCVCAQASYCCWFKLVPSYS